MREETQVEKVLLMWRETLAHEAYHRIQVNPIKDSGQYAPTAVTWAWLFDVEAGDVTGEVVI